MAFPFIRSSTHSHEAGFVLVDIGERVLKIVAWNKDEEGVMRVVVAEHFDIDLFAPEQAFQWLFEILEALDLHSRTIYITLPPTLWKVRIGTYQFKRTHSGNSIKRAESENIVKRLNRKARKELREELAKSVSILPGELEMQELKILETKIDGYKVTKLIGYKGGVIEFKVLASFYSDGFYSQLRTFARRFKTQVLLTPHPVIALEQFAKRKKKSGTYINVGDSTTQVTIVQNEKICATEDFKTGVSNFITAVAQEFGMTEPDAAAFVKKYQTKQLSKDTTKQVQEVFSPIAHQWQKNLETVLSRAKCALPTAIWLFGGGSMIPEIKERVEDIPVENLSFDGELTVQYLTPQEAWGKTLRFQQAADPSYTQLFLVGYRRGMEQSPRVRDISPPKKFKKPATTKETFESDSFVKQRRKSYVNMTALLVKVVIVLVLLGIVGAVALHFVFAKATITIWPETRGVKVEKTVTVAIAQEGVDTAAFRIPAATFVEEKEDTKIFSATGFATQEGKASGKIRVFNKYGTAPQILIATTRFISEDGKLFRSIERESIPGGHFEGGKLVPGYKDIEVVAAKAGPDYNIEASNFSIPGLAGSPLYTAIYGESQEAMAGGTMSNVAIVTEEDIKTARKALIADLKEEVRVALETRIPENLTIVPASLAPEILEAGSLVKAGAQLDEFTYTVRVKFTGFAFDPIQVEELARALMAEQIREGEVMNENSFSLTYEDKNIPIQDGELLIGIRVTAQVYEEINIEALREQLRGLSREQALNTLAGHTSFARSLVSFWPFWISTIPNDIERVIIAISLTS